LGNLINGRFAPEAALSPKLLDDHGRLNNHASRFRKLPLGASCASASVGCPHQRRAQLRYGYLISWHTAYDFRPSGGLCDSDMEADRHRRSRACTVEVNESAVPSVR